MITRRLVRAFSVVRGNRMRLVLGTGAAFLLGLAEAALAQTIQPELRLDVLGPRPYSIQPGIGATIPLGYYARLGAVLGYGTRRDETLIADRWRADLLARVTLDPFRQQRWGLSLGGGLSFRRRTHLAAIAELEGPAVGELIAALQLGVSGGIRVGLIVRRAVQGRR